MDQVKKLPARLLIGIVLGFNLQSAVALLVQPDGYARQFALTGGAGAAAVRGFGVLFLMWIVPYVVALWDPVRFRLVLYICLAMQAIGLFGEALILTTIPAGLAPARQLLIRFIVFDAFGLVALLLAAWLSRTSIGSTSPNQ
jgi:hypothetical protein